MRWYDALVWAGDQICFSTIDLAGQISGSGRHFLSKKKYANTLTQKLWKWGYLRKASGPELAPEIHAARARAVELRPKPKKKNETGRGGPGYNQGRPPSIWTITPKGIWRLKHPAPAPKVPLK
jgi:hypothetical protein